MTDAESKPALSAREAAQALKEVERAGRRSEALLISAIAGPQLILWGVIWVVCNSFQQFGPPWAPILWLPGVIIGSVGSAILSRLCGGGGLDWRRGGSFLVVVFFMNAVAAGLGLHDPDQYNLLISLLVACSYLLVGIWRSGRLGWIGFLLAALILVGWWGVHAWFALWMGLVGGGTLILTGLWLRRL
jgi:hypothetical protein